MARNEALFALLLASRLTTTAYIATPVKRDTTDDSLDGDLVPTVAKVRLAIEDATPSFTYEPPPTYTYDSLASYTYDTQPSFTYSAEPSYTYNLPAKRREAGDVHLGIRGLIERDNVSLSHPPPNPTAIPFAFKTSPFSSTKITSLLDPNPPPPPDTRANSSALRAMQQPSASTTVTVNPSSLSALLSAHGTTQTDVPIAAAYMTTIDPQNGLPKLIPINAVPTSVSTVDSAPGISSGHLTPTIVSGGTAYVLESFTGTNLNSAYAPGATTAAFQFVSPSHLSTYSAPSAVIGWSLTGKGDSGGDYSIYTKTLPTGMATGPLTTTKIPGATQSLLEFFSVGPQLRTSAAAAASTEESWSSEAGTKDTSSESAEPTTSFSVRPTQARHTEGAAATMGSPMKGPSTDDSSTKDSLTGDSSTNDPLTDEPSTNDPLTNDSSTNDPLRGDSSATNPSTDDPSTNDTTTFDSSTEDSTAAASERPSSCHSSSITKQASKNNASTTSGQATRSSTSTKTTSVWPSVTSEHQSLSSPADFIAKTTGKGKVAASAASHSSVYNTTSSAILAPALIFLTLLISLL